jgi:hypothetical protein
MEYLEAEKLRYSTIHIVIFDNPQNINFKEIETTCFWRLLDEEYNAILFNYKNYKLLVDLSFVYSDYQSAKAKLEELLKE